MIAGWRLPVSLRSNPRAPSSPTVRWFVEPTDSFQRHYGSMIECFLTFDPLTRSPGLPRLRDPFRPQPGLQRQLLPLS